MPVYRFRLKNASGDARNISASAADEDEALQTIERQEHKKVSFYLDAREAAEFEKQLRSGTLSGRNKARLFAHQQEKPYRIVKGGEE